MSEISVPKDDFRPGRRSWIDYKTYEPFNPFQIPSRYRDIQFLFVPDSPVAHQFMNDSIEMFRINTDHRSKLTVKAMKTEKELESYSLYQQRDDSDSVVIGTILKGFENDWPTSLDYKIRHGPSSYSSFFYTNLKYRVNGPSYMNAYTDTYFLSWQASVEETFIKRKMDESGSANFTYKVWMQRFPYPEHRSSSMNFSMVTLVPWVLGYGYLFFIINIVRRVIEEKANGSKELLKMMGMTDFTYWASTFMNYFISALITLFIITIIFKIPFKNGTVFMKNSEFFLTFFVLCLFMISLILFCMLFSIFFKRSVFAIIALLVIYVLSLTFIMIVFFMKDTDLNYSSLSLGSKLGICLLPTGAFLTLFYLVGFNEATGDGLKWNNLTEFDQIPDLNILMVLGTMVFSCFLYIFAIWYFDAVWPWQPGVPKPFYFLFMPSYCTTPGVIIQNLSKEFRSGLTSKVAVNNVSLNIYRGQITALLGHNGAGKTTTINILTGLFTPTSGTASINGLDILADTFNARRGLGVCPQHNVLFDTLTVEEHLKIYAAMKGVQWGNLNAEITQVLNILKLSEKRNELIKNLSGGMKRKLSLGIAIVGGSKVLFLDEPTSGMDVEARRSVWDALLDIRHTRTIILTTHYMEEADILGDRIAIMAEGEIQCCGSPMFLKQKFGTGYHLHVVKNSDFDLQGLRSLLQKYIPEASIRNELEKEISFSLTSDTGGAFGDLFEELESKKQKLGVISFGITVTTMEDVFLNVANISDIKYKLRPEAEQTNGVSITMENFVWGTPARPPKILITNSLVFGGNPISVVVSILLIIPFAIFVHYAFFGIHSNAIGTALLMLFLYGWASIPFSYLMSFMFKKGGAGFSIIVGFCAILGVGLGSILRSVSYGLSKAKAEQIQKAVWVFRIFPTFSFAQGMSNLFGIAFYNAYCESVPYEDLQFNCYSSTMDQHNPLFKCCKNVCGDNCLQPENIFTWDKSACGRDLLFLFIDGCIYFSILLLLETRFLGAFFRAAKSRVMSLRKSMIGQIIEENITQDSDVVAEEERIRNLTHLGNSGEALVVSGLTKVYRNFYAVNRLTFGIHPEECFGLLGVNGAGKTTTFRMLTGDTFPTDGNAITSSSSIRTDMNKFQSQLGYCPQFDALIDRLTGREMLSLFARLRGLTGFELDERVNKLIRMTDLAAHADKQTQFYSGGSKRKLSVALSLIGAPPLILLDEPTAGVDPVSRRKIWNILSQARNNTGAAVILTTHSMEESEALCNRLAIMVNGRLQCLGSIQQLKSKYGQGYTIIIKMKKEHQDNQEAVNAIKTHVQSNLPGANLKDEHQGMVQYHVIDPSISLSRLFKFMSSMKNQFELEDYLISDTSLEQIFLTFARAQRIMR
ncbi:ATP-binding cassette sub-family A member 3 [Trichonephila inaurata madagascariensis]|uniref:ATP-binding cassette sub-family A member 3 n=1 Tax=Trichonephila inaurata madagascariensis TaxID=2747483 RepID=A0A8X7BVE9_9ARAC|nr:ATP-binding cassette sub-family A member 3 [Trichonephila inaurata madagascariensis]